MAQISDLAGTLKQDFKGAVQSTGRQVGQAGDFAVQNAKNQVTNAARQAVQGSIRAGVSGVIGAASAAMSGNLGGVGPALGAIPAGIGGAIDRASGGVFGLSGGETLSGPGDTGSSTTLSSNGGIQEGNALYGAVARSDPLMSFYWYAHMPILSSVYGSIGIPWNYVEEATLPFRQYNVTSVFREGRLKNYAGQYSIDSLRLGFYLDVNNTALTYLRGWQAAITQPTSRANAQAQGGMYNMPNQYQKDIFIYLLDPIRQAIAVIQYIECWPTNLDALTLDSASSTRLVGNVNFSVGDVFVNTMDVSAGDIGSILGSLNPIGALTGLARGVAGTAMNAAGSSVNGGISSITNQAARAWF